MLERPNVNGQHLQSPLKLLELPLALDDALFNLPREPLRRIKIALADRKLELIEQRNEIAVSAEHVAPLCRRAECHSVLAARAAPL